MSRTFRFNCSSEWTPVIMITDIAASAKSKAPSGPRREVASARSLGTAWASTISAQTNTHGAGRLFDTEPGDRAGLAAIFRSMQQVEGGAR